jgi:hypothetical protein
METVYHAEIIKDGMVNNVPVLLDISRSKVFAELVILILIIQVEIVNVISDFMEEVEINVINVIALVVSA